MVGSLVASRTNVWLAGRIDRHCLFSLLTNMSVDSVTS